MIDVHANDLVVDPNAEISLLLEELEKLSWLGFRRNRYPKRDQDIFIGAVAQYFVGDRFCRFGTDLAAAAWTKCFGDTRPKQFQIIIDLGHGSDGGTRRFDLVRLLDRDRRRNAADIVDARLVHAVEELPHVGTESFDVAALAFGVNRFEGEAGFSGAARAGNNGQFTQGKIDIDAFEIVLARPSNLNATTLGRSSDAFFFSNL